MARRRKTPSLAFDALSVEGSLIAPAMLSRIALREADGQKEADYQVPKGLTLRDEIARYFRIGQVLSQDLNASATPSVAAAHKFAQDLLQQVFGFHDVARVGSRVLGEKVYAVTLEALGGRVPVVVVPPSDELDRASEHLPGDGRKRSAASAIQDWLNASEEALWGLCCNGDKLRLVRDNESLTRPAYIEADLRQMFEDEAFADFAALWLLVHVSRFGVPSAPVTDCALERWREAGAKEGVAARDRLGKEFEVALLALGNGFLEDADFRSRILTGDLALDEYFSQLLHLAYRLIFLLVAEDRGLLHGPNAPASARQLYAEGYSLTHLREHAVRRTSWDTHHDRWQGLLVAFAALRNGNRRLGLPGLGGLFRSVMMMDLEKVPLPNRALMEAIYRLSWLREGDTLVPVNWRDMETEELGSVYEGLLELTPRISGDGRTFYFAEGVETKGNQRKTTGSYYTPDSLVQALLDTALDPVLDKTEAEADDPAKALLKLSVIDPACGSGHFLLAAARRIATRLARIRAEGTPSLADFRHALRDVARCCIHGVDRNPMAVELTKVALWIETVDPGLPLGFFDAQIRCGDALLGVFDLQVLQDGIPDAAYKPLTGDDKDTARYYLQANRAATSGQGGFDFGTGQATMPAMKPLALDFSGFRDLPEDTVEQIGAKAKRFKELRKGQTFVRAKAAADLYVAAFLLPKVGGAPAGASARTVPTTEELWLALNQGKTRQAMLDAPKAARRARALHWPLEFPDVMQRGGFDVVLGNPPWERIKLQEKEFFAARDAAIANASNKAVRDRLIKALALSEPGSAKHRLFQDFETEKRLSEATSAFVRVAGEDGGRFPLSGTGDVNTYALFAELFAHLPNNRGRSGVILPTGIATDATTAPFFASLVSEKRLSQLIDFENRERIFPGVYFRVKFCLLTIGRQESKAGFAFFLTQPSQLADPERRFTLSSEQIAAINPNTKTASVFRSRSDAELTAKIYANVPVLMDGSNAANGNLWGVNFMAMFHMANDSSLFRTASDLEAAGFHREGANWVRATGDKAPNLFVPFYEAKMVTIYDHRYGDFALAKERTDADYREIPSPPSELLSDPNFEVTPRYWISEEALTSRLREKAWSHQWVLGWRDITNATNQRTLISCILPRVACNDKFLLMMPDVGAALTAGLYANLCSLATDFAARQKVGGTSFKYFTMRQIPVLPPDFYTEPRLAFVTPKVLELTYTSHSLAPFARDLGHDGPPFAWDEDRRALLRADLDAFYARAYGLTRDELRYILDPADVKGPDYPSETFRVLKEKEIRQYGEYRTRRLVLDAWDRMEANGEFTAMGM
ncbi:MAG TPA: N-6 DNA methylase [Devosiaceae bacterium]